jgi:hypothetical protein
MNDYRHKYDFPIRAGSWRSDLTNPALEFVKTVRAYFEGEEQRP